MLHNMEITPGKYKLRNGDIGIVESKITVPVPLLRGRVEGATNASWNLSGTEYSGHKQWDIIGSVEEENKDQPNQLELAI